MDIEADRNLVNLLPSGSTVYFILRSRTASGKTSHVSAYVLRGSLPIALDGLICTAGLAVPDKHGHMLVRALGTDPAAIVTIHLRQHLAVLTNDPNFRLNYAWL